MSASSTTPLTVQAPDIVATREEAEQLELPPLIIRPDGTVTWLDEGRGPVLGLPDRRPRAL